MAIQLTQVLPEKRHSIFFFAQGQITVCEDVAQQHPLLPALLMQPKAGEAGWSKSAATVSDGQLLMTAVVGLGETAQLTAEAIRRAAGSASRLISESGQVVIHLPACVWELKDGLQAFAEGWQLGAYRFDRYRSQPEPVAAQVLSVFAPAFVRIPDAQAALNRGALLAEAVNVARDLVNTPANDMMPVHFAARAMEYGKKAGLEPIVLGEAAMRSLDMGALLAVAQGSRQEPQLVVLHYRGNPAASETLGFVGKGITFDSGGISIKPSEGMHEMKDDMAGAAAVLAATCAIAKLGLPVNVLAVMPCVENMPSSHAYRPGDVLHAANGKTIEVISTDAEGRLILADALWYAERQGATKLVDIATLTGACKVALGDLYAGVIDNDAAWAAQLLAAAQTAGEDLWRLPGDKRYKELIKSAIADLKNSGGRYGGAITGGLFISEFVTKPWAHIDIGGAVARDKTTGYLPAGPTGIGVRTLVALAEAHSHAG